MPIGMVAHAVVRRRVEVGQRLRFDDLELPESLALEAWTSVIARSRQSASRKATSTWRSAGRTAAVP